VGRWILVLSLLAGVALCWCCTSAAPVHPKPVTVTEKDLDEDEGAEGAEGEERVIVEESSIIILDDDDEEEGEGSGYGEGTGFGQGSGRVEARRRRASRVRSGSASADPLVGLDERRAAAGDGDGEAPPPVEEPESPLSLVDRVLEKLDLGNLAFNTPEVMGYSETRTVELLLSTEESPQELAEALPDGPSGTAEGVRVAPEMEAALVGSGFTIEAVTPVRQAVSTLQRTRWAWTITPKDKGSQSLHLTLAARIKVEGKDTPYVVRTFSREIQVEVSLWGTILDLLSKNWQWLWSTLVVPLALWWWKRRRK
jgi:hypothetical protein